MLPRSEVCLLVHNAPYQIGIKIVAGCLAHNQSIVTMNPVLIEQVEAAGKNKQCEEDDNDALHRVAGGERILRVFHGQPARAAFSDDSLSSVASRKPRP